jgi:hypothetical protein
MSMCIKKSLTLFAVSATNKYFPWLILIIYY